MLNQEYCSEIESLIIQFQSAIDDNKIYRKDETGNIIRIDTPRCVLSGKAPTFLDIINKAGNITFPVIVVEPNSINLTKDRMQNKILGQTVHQHGNRFSYRQPVPISIRLTTHIYTRYWDDLWQIWHSFATYMQDYFFISWRTPTELTKEEFCEQIRCKVSYGGTLNIDYPKTLEAEKLFIIHGTVDFTIDGFLFEKPIKEHSKMITQINNYEHIGLYSAGRLGPEGDYQYYRKDGWPSITNIFFNDIDIKGKSAIDVKSGAILQIKGRSFFTSQDTDILIIPHDEIELDEQFEKYTIATLKMGEITGYKLKDGKSSEVINNNEMTIKIPELPKGITYNVVVYNKIGYAQLDLTFNS